MQVSAPTVETRLLALLAKPQISGVDLDSAAILSLSCDWDVVVRMARTHGVDALMYRRLTSNGQFAIPEAPMNLLIEQASVRAMRNLQLTAELVRVTALLDKAHIPVMPFKGPALAERLYGDVALRTFSDLDVLVRRSDFTAVKSLLVADGFEDHPGVTGTDEESFLETQMGYEFIKRSTRTVVEVHWALINRVHAFDLDIDDVWRRATTRRLSHMSIAAMSNEDLLIYLCAHGAKSFWARLGWICDVAALAEINEGIDWNYVLDTSASIRGEAILFLGLRLAKDIFATHLPDVVERRLENDRASARLALKVNTWLWSNPDPPISSADKIRFHLQMRERMRDRLPYVRHILQNALESKFG